MYGEIENLFSINIFLLIFPNLFFTFRKSCLGWGLNTKLVLGFSIANFFIKSIDST